MRKWPCVGFQVVNGIILLAAAVFGTAVLLTSKYDFVVELSIALDSYLGPLQLFINAFYLIALSIYALTLFKQFSVFLQLFIFVVGVGVLLIYSYAATLFYDALKQNLLFYIILCGLFYGSSVSMLAALYFASKMVFVRQLIFSVVFLFVSLTALVIIFCAPPTNVPLTAMLSKTQSEPVIIESGGNCHMAPPSTSFAIMAMESMRFAPMAVISVRITADDVLVGASSRWKDVEEMTMPQLRQKNLGKVWLKNDPYRLYHYMQYQTQYFSFDYQEILGNITKYLSAQSFNSLRELFLVGMRLYIPFVLNIQAYSSEETQQRVAEQLTQTLEDLGLAQPDKTSFYSIRTESFIIYRYISAKYSFIPFVLPPRATAESWCNLVDPSICSTQTRFTYQNLMDTYKARQLSKNPGARNLFSDLTAVNSLTTYCFAKKMNFIRIYTNLDNNDVIRDCLMQNYLIAWISAMVVFYIGIIGLLSAKMVYRRQNKAEAYS